MENKINQEIIETMKAEIDEMLEEGNLLKEDELNYWASKTAAYPDPYKREVLEMMINKIFENKNEKK